MKITPKMALELASHEAVVRQTYKDSVGVNTWSIGLTNSTGHNVDRYIDNPQPMQKCLEIFIWALKKYADQVDKAFAGYELTEAEYAAALSFHYNTGAINRASWVKSFKAGDYEKSKAQFMLYKKPKEIIPRRKKERDLFFSGRWSSDGKVTEFTKLTSKRTPNWSSGVRVDISKDIEALLSTEVEKPTGLIGSFFKLLAAVLKK